VLWRTFGGDPAVARRLAELFDRKPGQASVRLEIIREGDFCLTLEAPRKVRPDKEFVAEVEAICGKGALIML
jgi:hypothetical protein